MRKLIIHIFRASCNKEVQNSGLSWRHGDAGTRRSGDSRRVPASPRPPVPEGCSCDGKHGRRYTYALYLVSSIVFAVIIFTFCAVASISVANSVLLKFEDSSTNVKSLADDPTVLLLPLHTVAFYCKIDFQWDPAREQMVLTKNDVKAKVVLGNQHALVNETKLRPLSNPPIILRGAVALSPQDIAFLLQDLLPSMDVSWDKAKATIEVKKGLPHIPPVISPSAGKFELKTIVIDPGHGGYDPGAVKSGVREKQIVLDIALHLSKLIESKSTWESVLARDSDEFITLRRRTEIANQYPADSTLFISIHCNADRNSLGHGLETFVFDLKATDAEAAALAKRENADEKMDLAYILSHCYHVGTEPYSLKAAKEVQASLIKRLKLRNRGVKRAPFYVLAGTKMPAILVELGFVSNYYDRKKLQSASFRQSAAEALFDAIRNFDKAAGKLLVKAN